MGKGLPHSRLHDYFSKWHWQKCKREAFLCDIDRIWVELRESKPKAVFDLKLKEDKLTVAGKILGEWFESQNVPFYIVQIDFTSERVWRIYRPKTDLLVELNEGEMVDWINNDLDEKVCEVPVVE